MPAILAIGRVALTWLGRIGIGVFVVTESQKFLKEREQLITEASAAAEDAGFSADEQKKIIAATTYEQVEKKGDDPNDFWAGLTPAEKQALQFSPESLQADIGRTKFLGISSAFLFGASLFAGGVAAVRGIPILLSTLAQLRNARAAGATALELMTIIEAGKIAGIAKVWVPGLVGGIAAAGGWLTSSMTNNLNDATLWGRIFLGQAADDFASQVKQLNASSSGSGFGGSRSSGPRTIIRIVEDKKPEQFIGTLFSAKLGRADSFERKVDDEITDLDDLREDAKVNLNRWLASLPNRMGYSVVIRKDPVDEFGTRQSGIWATLTIFITHISGKTSPIDTILLGPVTPQTRLELQKQTKSIENEIQGFVSAATVHEIEVPNGAIDIFTPDGERASLSQTAAQVTEEARQDLLPEIKSATPAPAPAPVPEVPLGTNIKTESQIRSMKAKQKELGRTKELTPDELKNGPAVQTKAGTSVGKKLPGVNLFVNQQVVVDTGGSKLNVRAQPSTSGRVILQAKDGDVLTIEDGYKQADGFYWVKVSGFINKTGFTGAWVADEFIFIP